MHTFHSLRFIVRTDPAYASAVNQTRVLALYNIYKGVLLQRYGNQSHTNDNHAMQQATAVRQMCEIPCLVPGGVRCSTCRDNEKPLLSLELEAEKAHGNHACMYGLLQSDEQGTDLVGHVELSKGGDELSGGGVDVDSLKAVGLADTIVAQIQRPAQAALRLPMHTLSVQPARGLLI